MLQSCFCVKGKKTLQQVILSNFQTVCNRLKWIDNTNNDPYFVYVSAGCGSYGETMPEIRSAYNFCKSVFFLSLTDKKP